MKFEQVLQLVDAVSVSALTEFKYEEGGVKISMKKTAEGTTDLQAAPSRIPKQGTVTERGIRSTDSETAAELASDTEKETEAGKVVTSPLVGTFYAAPAEDAEPFVHVGDQVEKGQVLAIIEAMKLMNEIESDFSGRVVKILAENGKAVEYGQPLFIIKE